MANKETEIFIDEFANWLHSLALYTGDKGETYKLQFQVHSDLLATKFESAIQKIVESYLPTRKG